MNLFGRNSKSNKTGSPVVEEPSIQTPPMEAFHPQQEQQERQEPSTGVVGSAVMRMESDDSIFEDVELADYVNEMASKFIEEDRQRRRKRFLVGVVAALAIVAIALGVVLPTMNNNNNNNNHNNNHNNNNAVASPPATTELNTDKGSAAGTVLQVDNDHPLLWGQLADDAETFPSNIPSFVPSMAPSGL